MDCADNCLGIGSCTGRPFAYAYSQYNVPEPKELQANQVSTIVAGDGTTQLAKLVPPEGNRTQVKLDEVPDYVEDSVLSAEDREFWTNSGFSFTGLGRAVLGKLTGDSTAGGGSTITQQYVKNTLVGDSIPMCVRSASLSIPSR